MKSEKTADGVRTREDRKKLTALDVCLIVGVILLLVAIIGQDVAVYLMNKSDSGELFEVSFRIRSVDEKKMQALVDLRPAAGDMFVISGGKELGRVYGGLVKGDKENDHLYTVTGTMTVKGSQKDGACIPYGFDKALKTGEWMYVIFEGSEDGIPAGGYTIELVEIKLLRNM